MAQERLTSSDSEIDLAHRERYLWASRDVCPGSSVLDAACGVGYGADILLRDQPSVSYVGIDRSDCVEARFTGSRRYFWQHDFDSRWPRVASRFNVVCAFALLERLQDPQRFVKWATMVAAGGGVIWASLTTSPQAAVNEFHLHDFVPGDLEAMFNLQGWAMTDSFYQPSELAEVGRFVEAE